MALLLLALQGQTGRTGRHRGPGTAPGDLPGVPWHWDGSLLPFLLAVTGVSLGAGGSWQGAGAHRGSPGGGTGGTVGMSPEMGQGPVAGPQAPAHQCMHWEANRNPPGGGFAPHGECPSAHSRSRAPSHLYPPRAWVPRSEHPQRRSPKHPQAARRCPLLTSPLTVSSAGRKRRRRLGWWRTLSQQSLSWQDEPHLREQQQGPSGGSRPPSVACRGAGVPALPSPAGPGTHLSFLPSRGDFFEDAVGLRLPLGSLHRRSPKKGEMLSVSLAPASPAVIW